MTHFLLQLRPKIGMRENRTNTIYWVNLHIQCGLSLQIVWAKIWWACKFASIVLNIGRRDSKPNRSTGYSSSWTSKFHTPVCFYSPFRLNLLCLILEAIFIWIEVEKDRYNFFYNGIIYSRKLKKKKKNCEYQNKIKTVF